MTAPLSPTWLIPSAAGQLSNKRGSDTGADKLLLQVTYPTAGDNAGTIRAIATRVGRLGGSQSPEPAWDSGWTGTPATTATPFSAGAGNFQPWATFTYNGRIYAAKAGTYTIVSNNFDGPLWSAPITGGSVGSWRAETSIHYGTFGASGTTQAIALVFNYGQPLIYAVDSSKNIAYATIQANGFVGPWSQSNKAPAQAGALFGNGDATATTQGWLGIVGRSNPSGIAATVSNNVQNVGLNADNSLQSWASGTVLPNALCNFGFYYDPVNKFVVTAGGLDTVPNAVTNVYNAAVGALGAISAWSVQTNLLPAARHGLGLLVENGYIFACGGSNVAALTGGQTTIYAATLATTVGTGQVGVFSAALTPAMPTALTFGAWFLAGPVGAVGTYSYLVSTGGMNTASTLVTTTSEILNTGAGALSGSWSNGAHSLTAGNLGTGGVLTTNQDGSQSVTFLYGAFGSTALLNAGFLDGDQVQWTVQFTDQANGDPSPLSLPTLIKIGQPPTISNVTWSDTSGKPMLSFTYLPGPGEGPCA